MHAARAGGDALSHPPSGRAAPSHPDSSPHPRVPASEAPPPARPLRAPARWRAPARPFPSRASGLPARRSRGTSGRRWPWLPGRTDNSIKNRWNAAMRVDPPPPAKHCGVGADAWRRRPAACSSPPARPDARSSAIQSSAARTN